ncbi:oxidoreductase FAD/NAD(P)-binding domain protein [gamma proteobacterium BDW918]|uniref:Uncharacterized protein n=1 Tax=Zhongshania aliphaticivorans TaxID=1470434 RepID=A0A127M6F0_9GAMM|nr:2Fe-2S iron-sulfur cluster binding domain-containing protein [Zhongshania aliphaticivorans]AMO68813.1 hypothetical protein AZF00_11115 [Zhongshania aliphaticivorans]EIF43555.1 oxidoreductase FAD/NAD(P)-binding domain protein [gamma proteobacterium BDW918]
MSTLTFNGQEYVVQDDENVLDTLLRNKISIPHGCRAGACQACILIAKPDQIPDDCQHGLSNERIQQGYFLSCRCEPEQDMTLRLPNLSGEKHLATIAEKMQLNPKILRLRLHCRLRWRAGQYITLWLNDTTARCYSIASVASLEDFIELHIRIYPKGAVSPQLLNTEIGDELLIQGPYGECVYDNKQSQQSILLIAAGTGLAPLFGVAKDALNHDHQSTIHLLFTVKQASDYYMLDALQQLQADHPQFSYSLASADGPPHETWQQQLQENFTELRGRRVYICGGNDFVSQAKRQCFMQGATRRDIICEEFINFSAAS